LVGPWYCEPAGIGWFRGFPGGLVSTCGLDHTLLGGPDDATVFNYPHRVTETYGLHGRYTGLPARLAGYGVRWAGRLEADGLPCRIRSAAGRAAR